MEISEHKELYKRESVYWKTGVKTTFRLMAGPGSRNYNNPEIKEKDRIIYLQLECEGKVINFPYAVKDQEAIWQEVFDVWVLPQKKLNYAKRFIKLIKTKLLQAKLEGFGNAYWEEL